ncbi:mitochondrial protein Pet127-domain-containing protein [Microdochium bolleyi]|uniref:Mitochondrial protein Pet127-domain-containing protein n=1 Tax=Microdochium bolleyi TaxID=196109 RepID=A0A136J797_9PEZI|nr:mitochondrial protein Pet127-domain-containing protein [Microdochium bolleyi]
MDVQPSERGEAPSQQPEESTPSKDDTGAAPDPPPTKGRKAKASTTAKSKAKATAVKATGSKSSSPGSQTVPITPALQGAIDTFKKVLADQKIDLAHLTQMLDQEASPTKRKNKPSKKERAKRRSRAAKEDDGHSVAKLEETSGDKHNDKAEESVDEQGTEPNLEKGAKKGNQSTKAWRTALEAQVAARKAERQAQQQARGASTEVPTGSSPGSPLPEKAEAGIGGSRPHALGIPLGHAETSAKGNFKGDHKAAELSISTIKSAGLELTPIDKVAVPVPRLSHGLDRVLFNPGVYFLQDPRSRVFNFDPYLANIMPIQEFDFNALKQYITSSKDTTLIAKAKAYKKKYTGSTSSMTAMLSHFHYLLSSWRPVNGNMMSAEFKPDSKRFTRLTRAPAATFLHWKDGCYAIDADKEFDSANILSMLGKSMEKLLTLPKHKFEQYRHINSDQISEEERNAEEAFHYTGFQDFMMRSQLDAYDKRIPGTGMFDLKTRAVVSIRMDAQNFQKGIGYEIRQRFGQWESFEREYYDMIRSAFLKYSLQVRMGRMDGIYVAYHNTQRIFGFQYISISEMDYALHGTSNTTLGDREYKLSLTLLNQLLDRASERWPGQSLRLHFETRESVVTPFMYVFARPVKQGDIEAVQNAGKAQVEEFERSILGLDKKADSGEPQSTEPTDDSAPISQSQGEEVEQQVEDSSSEADTQRLSVWNEVQEMVEDAMSDEEQGMSSVREAIQNALEESSLLGVESTSEARQYIDALITAITGVQPQTSDAPKDDVEEEQQDTGTGTVATNTETTSPPASAHVALEDNTLADTDNNTPVPEGPDTAHDATSSQVNAVTDEATATPNEEVVSANEDVDDIKRGSLARPSLAPLKDLITLSAQRIQERPAADIPDEGSDENLPKLKVFEEILRQMIMEAKAGSSVAESNSALAEASSTDDVNSHDASTATQVAKEDGHADPEPLPADGQFDLLGMVLTIKNKVNGAYVERPNDLTRSDSWDVEYNIEELPDERAHRLYSMCLERRRTIFRGLRDKTDFEDIFGGALARSTNKGADFRKKEIARAKKMPVNVYDIPRPLSYRRVFGDIEARAASALPSSRPSGGATATGQRTRRSLRKRPAGTGLGKPKSLSDSKKKDGQPAAKSKDKAKSRTRPKPKAEPKSTS